jgi:hypothetical protein
MKYTIEMASGGVIYIPDFMKISTGVQKLIGGIHMQTCTQTPTPRLSHKTIFIL